MLSENVLYLKIGPGYRIQKFFTSSLQTTGKKKNTIITTDFGDFLNTFRIKQIKPLKKKINMSLNSPKLRYYITKL